ncbi:WXG100 family type VII secretion target [Streptomyces sp. RB6PN25]|uniref:ESAT-6-like protein n=1 Tax=Streptomyces humicola TaxID=2953240 RepID=A0ABT1PU99_9ACTN|nr:WXG100 family type VII secretion target [Streptomyces humicola]MCQ4081254.1 WXG100 family type VII secretion target [Streptomyces humicola]
MANVNVTYEEMQAAATKLTNGQNEITNQLHALQSYVQQLVQHGYVTDRSSKAFEQSYAEFNKGATQTIDGLTGMAKFLQQAADAFRQADESLAHGIGKG